MPFCARCFGASIGHVGAFILFLAGKLPSLQLCLIFVAAMGIDWSLQKWFGIASNNNRRLVTGILGGIGVGAIMWMVVAYGYHLVKGAV
jgi:uncharacterized membrane protein